MAQSPVRPASRPVAASPATPLTAGTRPAPAAAGPAAPQSAKPAAPAAARRGMPRLRVLPLVMFAGVLMLGVRVSDLWTGFAHITTSGRAAQAEEEVAADAATDAAGAAPAEVAAVDPAADAAAIGSGADPLADLPDDLPASERALLEGLAARRTELDDRARDLDRREALLAVAQQRLDQKMTELTSLRTEVESLVDKVDEQRENQVKTLVGIYEAMRPGDAAVIFNGLEMEVLLAVLQRMREQKSAPILAGMNPERARQVTAELMERQAAEVPEVPEEEPVATGLPLLPPPPAQQ